jgi:phospholipid-translocating ATPase
MAAEGDAAAGGEEGQQTQRSTPAKRIRWATQRVKGTKASQKRKSIFHRTLSRRGADEKKRESAGSDPSDPKADQDAATEDGEDGEGQPKSRTIYFNIPLPADAKDEEGRPLQHFARNKIRTAKYTPISFIPKNLYYQFHNIANIYFFAVIILGVSRRLCVPSSDPR